MLSLSPKSTMPSVMQTADQLRHLLAEHDDAVLDIADVADADLSFIQLVEAGRLHAASSGGSLRLRHPANPVVTALLDRAGFLTDPSPTDVDFWFHGALPR